MLAERRTLRRPRPRGGRAVTTAAALLAIALAGCGKQQTELGQGGSEVSGSAGPAGARGASRQLAHCDAPVATLALVENPSGYTGLASYQLPVSPVPLIRLLAQQSGCFRVVDRAGGLRGTLQEQELKDAGVVRADSSLHKGRGYEAQFSLTPSLTFSELDAGRGLGGLLAMIPWLSSFAGAAEQVKFKEAQVALLLTDNETTEQLAAATGSARATDLGIGGLVLGRVGGGAGVGWSNTNEGKVIAAAFLDAHNRLVEQVRAVQARRLPPPSGETPKQAGRAQ
jgi:curli biogenesis system outer membrane secretion channel CsgG